MHALWILKFQSESFDYNYAPINVNTRLSYSESSETITEMLQTSDPLMCAESERTTSSNDEGNKESSEDSNMCEETSGKVVIPESTNSDNYSTDNFPLYVINDNTPCLGDVSQIADMNEDSESYIIANSGVTNCDTGAHGITFQLETNFGSDQYLSYNANATEMESAFNSGLDTMNIASEKEIPLPQGNSGGYIRNYY